MVELVARGHGDGETNVPVHENAGALPTDIIVPVGRLDADIYNAEDMDGVTESLFGSGNLNYLTLQSRQTDAMMAEGGLAGEETSSDTGRDANDAGAMGGRILSSLGDLRPAEALAQGAQAGSADSAAAIPLTSVAPDAPRDIAAAPVDGSALASRISPPSSVTDSVFHERQGTDGHGGTDGVSGTSGHNGAPGNPGTGLGDVINNITNVVGDTLTQTINNVTNIVDDILHPPGTDIDLFAHNDLGVHPLDVNLDSIENIIGDINTGVDITHGDGGAALDGSVILAGIDIAHPHIPIQPPVDVPVVGGVIDNLPGVGDLTEDPAGAITALADGIVTDATQDIQNALQDPVGTVTGLTAQLTDAHALSQYALDLATGIAGGVTILHDLPLADGLPEVGGIAQEVQGLADSLTSGLPDLSSAVRELAAPLQDITGGAGDIPDVTALVQDLAAGTPLADVLALPGLGDISDVGGIVEEVQGLAGGAGDIPDVTALVQDISGLVADTLLADLSALLPGAGAPGGDDVDLVETNNLGLPGLNVNLDPVENLTGDIDILTGINNTNNEPEASAGIVLAGMPVMNETVSPVAVVESLVPATPADSVAASITSEVNTISQSADTALGLLGGITTSMGGTSAASQPDTASWPQASAPAGDSIGALDHVTTALTGGLPDPGGTVSEGLGLLHLGGDTHHHHIGGLFG